jgi:maleylpyruvate isomerase
LDDELRRDLDHCRASHLVLLGELERWLAGGGDVTTPSRLPGWTIGHVLTHLARNADSLTAIVVAADRGEVIDQYPSREARAAAIESGAGRPPAAQVLDVRRSIEALEAAWSGSRFEGEGRGLIGGVMPVRSLPRRRRREVEVHRVDLGIGAEPESWPVDFVRGELRTVEMAARSRLPMGLTEWPPEVLALAAPRRLAWLLGRHEAPGLPAAPPWS